MDDIKDPELVLFTWLMVFLWRCGSFKKWCLGLNLSCGPPANRWRFEAKELSFVFIHSGLPSLIWRLSLIYVSHWNNKVEVWVAVLFSELDHSLMGRVFPGARLKGCWRDCKIKTHLHPCISLWQRRGGAGGQSWGQEPFGVQNCVPCPKVLCWEGR